MVDLNKGATVELVKVLSDDIRTLPDGTKASSAGEAVRSAEIKAENCFFSSMFSTANFDFSKLAVDDSGFVCLGENLTTIHKNRLYVKHTCRNVSKISLRFKVSTTSPTNPCRVFFESNDGRIVYIHLQNEGPKLAIASYNQNYTNKISGFFTNLDYTQGTHSACFVKIGYTIFIYFDNVYAGKMNFAGSIDEKINKCGVAFRGNTSNNSYYSDVEISEFQPFVHMSLDDQLGFLQDLTNNAGVYTSIFENTTLKRLKDLHDLYGCCFTLMLFKQNAVGNPSFDISNTTTAFKSQFEACSHWLKMAYHGNNPTTHPSTQSVSELVDDVNAVYTAIKNFAGENSIDKVPRMSFFDCTKEQAIALKENGLIAGLLTADDDRSSNVGLNATELPILQNYDTYTDYENGITYFRTEERLDSTVYQTDEAVMSNFISKYDSVNNNCVFIVFAHSINSTENTRFNALAEWFFKKGFKFDFPINNI